MSSRYTFRAAALYFIPSCCRPKHSAPNSTVLLCLAGSLHRPLHQLCPSWGPAISLPVWIPKTTKIAQRVRKPLPFFRGFSKLDLSLLCKVKVRHMAQQAPSIKGLFLSRPNYMERMGLMLPYNQPLQSFPVGAAYFGLAPDHVQVLREHRGQRHSTGT